MQAAVPRELPPFIAALAASFRPEPPQNLKEYDPEWARAFWTGTVAASCDHARMLARVKVHAQDPELFTRTLVAWAATLPNPV